MFELAHKLSRGSNETVWLELSSFLFFSVAMQLNLTDCNTIITIVQFLHSRGLDQTLILEFQVHLIPLSVYKSFSMLRIAKSCL